MINEISIAQLYRIVYFVRMFNEEKVETEADVPFERIEYALKNPSFVLNRIKKLFSQIASGHLTVDEFRIALLYSTLFNLNKPQVATLKYMYLKHVKELLNIDNLIKDKNIILSIISGTTLTMDDFFKLEEDGETKAYKLISKEVLSPMFWFENSYKYLVNPNNDPKKESKQHRRFRRGMERIVWIYNNSKKKEEVENAKPSDGLVESVGKDG